MPGDRQGQERTKGEKTMAERMSIVVFSGTVDKLMAASILTTGGAAMGMEVEVFLTTWGLEAFRKDGYKTNMRVSKDFEDYAPVMMEQMMAKKVPSWMENFKNAREIGDVKVYACSMTMELFDMKLEDLEPIVDDVTGVATFVERAKDGNFTLFI
jgi:peroxiredoxin family protein